MLSIHCELFLLLYVLFEIYSIISLVFAFFPYLMQQLKINSIIRTISTGKYGEIRVLKLYIIWILVDNAHRIFKLLLFLHQPFLIRFFWISWKKWQIVHWKNSKNSKSICSFILQTNKLCYYFFVSTSMTPRNIILNIHSCMKVSLIYALI